MDKEELYASAIHDLGCGFTVRGATRMKQAAAAGHGRAQLALAHRRAEFVGPLAIHDSEVSDWLDKSVGNGVGEAWFFRSALRYVAGEKDQALDDLNTAAAADCSPAQTALGLAWLEHQGEDTRRNGLAWLSRAAGNDDKVARALERTDHFDFRSTDKHHAPELPAWAPERRRGDWEELCGDPLVKYAEAALSAIECAWLRISAHPRLRASRILDPVTRQARPDPIRTSTSMNFGLPTRDIFATRLIERAALAAEIGAENAEPLAVLRYRPGQQYHAHRDALGSEKLASDPLRASGDRTLTALLYLNEPSAGGATIFPFLDVGVKPRLGRLLVFQNMDAAGEPAQGSIHAGTPVESGMKWLASLWFRERPVAESFDLRSGSGRS